MKRHEPNRAEDVILEWEKTIFDFHPKLNCRKQLTEVEVRGRDANNAAISETVTTDDVTIKVGGDLLGAARYKDTFGDAKETIVDEKVKDANTARNVALNLLTDASFYYITATGRGQGDPTIMAGSILEIKGIGSKFSGKYLATSVRHRFVPLQGYETEFFLNRNTIVGNRGSTDTSGQRQAQAQPAARQEEERGVLMPEFSNLAWKKGTETITEAMVGEQILLTADVQHMRNGQTVKIRIFEKDTNNPDDFVKEFAGVIKDGKVEGKWIYSYIDDTDEVNNNDEQSQQAQSQQEENEQDYTKPEYYFYIEETTKNIRSSNSPILDFKDWVEIEVVDAGGSALANVEYKVVCPDGTEMTGTLDGEGKARIENIPPGTKKILIDDGTYELSLT